MVDGDEVFDACPDGLGFEQFGCLLRVELFAFVLGEDFPSVLEVVGEDRGVCVVFHGASVGDDEFGEQRVDFEVVVSGFGQRCLKVGEFAGFSGRCLEQFVPFPFRSVFDAVFVFLERMVVAERPSVWPFVPHDCVVDGADDVERVAVPFAPCSVFDLALGAAPVAAGVFH